MRYSFATRLRQTAIFISAVLAFCIAQGAWAHTTIVPRTMDEGVRVFADASISHGCNGKAVRAMGIVIPSGDSMLEEVGEPNQPAVIADHLDLGSSPRPSQDKDIFGRQTLTVAGSTRAFHYKRGFLQTDISGQIPFRFDAPEFKTDSCAKKLDILIPIVNWCTKSKTNDDRVDVWMGRFTEKFNDPAVHPEGFWPTITVYRDLEANPLDVACGDGIDLEWSPTDTEIDDLMPLKGFWPANTNP